jgi:hypothetical protein
VEKLNSIHLLPSSAPRILHFRKAMHLLFSKSYI